jgi:hypothetical protein
MPGAAARLRSDLQPTVQLPHPFAHACNADPRRGIVANSMASVLYFQNQVRVVANDANPRGGAAGVTMNVCQAFLYYPKDRRLDCFG